MPVAHHNTKVLTLGVLQCFALVLGCACDKYGPERSTGRFNVGACSDLANEVRDAKSAGLLAAELGRDISRAPASSMNARTARRLRDATLPFGAENLVGRPLHVLRADEALAVARVATFSDIMNYEIRLLADRLDAAAGERDSAPSNPQPHVDASVRPAPAPQQANATPANHVDIVESAQRIVQLTKGAAPKGNLISAADAAIGGLETCAQPRKR